MEVIGVFSSWVTALRKLSCCSLRRTSRIRKILFSTSPAMITPKKTIPRTSGNGDAGAQEIKLLLVTFIGFQHLRVLHRFAETRSHLALPEREAFSAIIYFRQADKPVSIARRRRSIEHR